MGAYFDGLSRFLDFSGRASRREFGLFNLVSFGLVFVLVLLEDQLGMATTDETGLLVDLYLLFIFVPTLAISVRRFHDMGYAGLWVLTTFIPLVGFVVFFVLLFKESDHDNEFGPALTT